MPSPDQLLQQALAALSRNQRQEARQLLEQAVAQSPDHAPANQQLAVLLAQAGDRRGAIRHFQAAARITPNNPGLLCSLAMVTYGEGDQEGADALFQRALALNPNLADAHVCLGIMRSGQQRAAEAETHLLAALKIAPSRSDIVYAYTRLLTETGRTDEAVDVLRRAVQGSPNDLLLQSKLCMMLNYVAGVTPQQLFQEHARFGQLVGRVSGPASDFSEIDRSPDRPLRVGYISADLRNHSVAYFLEPLLEHRSRDGYKVHCYHLGTADDVMTPRLRSLSDGWRTMLPCTDDQLLQAMDEDQIDIAVELAGHTSGNRLVALSRRAAPVQVSYIGYPNTTGLPTMDGRIVDSTTDPAGADALATERLLRLDPCFLCYRPPSQVPSPSPPDPSRPMTFCSFNSLAKLSPPTVSLWSRLLGSIPGSRLILKGKALGDPSIAPLFHQRFAAQGITADRLEFFSHTPTTADHLAHYHRADIALDPFPYNGTTTTCEAMLMGLPVVSLVGDRHAARVGASLLSTVGLADLIAPTESDYLRIATALAHDRPRLASLRASLRDQLLSSPLCNAAAFVPRYEAALRERWRAWCKR